MKKQDHTIHVFAWKRPDKRPEDMLTDDNELLDFVRDVKNAMRQTRLNDTVSDFEIERTEYMVLEGELDPDDVINVCRITVRVQSKLYGS